MFLTTVLRAAARSNGSSNRDRIYPLLRSAYNSFGLQFVVLPSSSASSPSVSSMLGISISAVFASVTPELLFLLCFFLYSQGIQDFHPSLFFLTSFLTFLSYLSISYNVIFVSIRLRFVFIFRTFMNLVLTIHSVFLCF